MSTTNVSNYTTLYSTTAGAVSPALPYGNANVEAFLNTGTDGGNTVQNIVANGTITANGNIVSNSFFVGDGGYLTNVTSNTSGTANFANFAGNVTVSSQPNITSVGTLVNVTVTGNVTSTTGVFNGNGAGLTNLNVSNLSGNPNFANFAGNVTNSAQPNITSVGTLVNVTVTGNITSTTGIFNGDGSGLSNINVSNITGNANFANFAGNVTVSSQPNITSLGNLLTLQVGNTTSNTILNFTPNTAIVPGTGDNVSLLKTGGYNGIFYSFNEATLIEGWDTNIDNAGIDHSWYGNDIVSGNTVYGGGMSALMYSPVGNTNAPSFWSVKVFEPTSNLDNTNTATATVLQAGQGGLTAIVGSQTSAPAIGAFIYGNTTQNQASAIRINRRRGNGDVRSNVAGSDYLGNIEWRAGGSATGSLNSKIVTFGAKVDSSYGGPGNVMPIGFEMDVVNSSNTFIAHSFYANGNVNFSNNVNATSFSGDGGNLSNITQASISNGTSNVRIATANGPITFSSNGVSNVATVSDTTFNIQIPITTPNSVYIGNGAGNYSTANTDGRVAIGYQSGSGVQLVDPSIAIGYQSGNILQRQGAIAIGYQTGQNQQDAAIAIGYQSGQDQGAYSTAVGVFAGKTTQQTLATGIGHYAGSTNQGVAAVALGYQAGQANQGANSVAIGTQAGQTNQATNSIILNATGSALNQTTANTFTVKPIRNAAVNANVLFYNNTTGEITYDVAGNVVANTANFANFAGTLINGNSNVTIAANANVTISSNGVANIIDVTSNGIASGSQTYINSNLTIAQSNIANSTNFSFVPSGRTIGTGAGGNISTLVVTDYGLNSSNANPGILSFIKGRGNVTNPLPASNNDLTFRLNTGVITSASNLVTGANIPTAAQIQVTAVSAANATFSSTSWTPGAIRIRTGNPAGNVANATSSSNFNTLVFSQTGSFNMFQGAAGAAGFNFFGYSPATFAFQLSGGNAEANAAITAGSQLGLINFAGATSTPAPGATPQINTTAQIYANATSGAVISAGNNFATDMFITTKGGNLNLLANTATPDSSNQSINLATIGTGQVSISSNTVSITGNVSASNVSVNTNGFVKLANYTAAALNAITGQIGWMAAVSDSASGGNPNGMIAFWDTTNARWSYVHDNSAV